MKFYQTKTERVIHRLSSKNFFRTIISFGVVLIVLLFTIITISDLLSNNDSLSDHPIMNSENVQSEIRINETRFREQLLSRLKKLYGDNSFFIIDSISKGIEEKNEIRKLIILSTLKSTDSNYLFKIKIDKPSTPLVLVNDLTVALEIDFDKLNNIIQSTSVLNDENTRYGNYLKIVVDYNKKLRIDYVVILIFLLIASLVIIYFIRRIGGKTKKNNLETTVDKLNSDREIIGEVNEILSEDMEISSTELARLKKRIAKVEENLKNYHFDNILESILYSDTIKSERKSMELYNRSTLMLVLGLLVAIAGIVVFYFTLPDYTGLKSSSEYIALTIRPSLVLIFIQSISFYLLKQYRNLINDYKYFYNEYLKKSKIFTAYQLMQSENLNNTEMKVIDSLLSNTSDIKTIETDEEDVSNQKIIEILKTLLDRLKINQ